MRRRAIFPMAQRVDFNGDRLILRGGRSFTAVSLTARCTNDASDARDLIRRAGEEPAIVCREEVFALRDFTFRRCERIVGEK